MTEYINEYEFYMELEDDIYNQLPACVLAFITSNSNKCEVLTNKLEELGDIVDMPIYIIDVADTECILDELNVTTTPTVLAYKNGEENYRFEKEFQVDYLADYIIELQKAMDQ